MTPSTTDSAAAVRAPTPAMRQYLDAKRRHRDAIVFFRMGDFYEMFYEDAVTAARALDLTLTSRSKDAAGGAIPMCGVPHHAADTYLARLVQKGFRVAICEQVEDPRKARGVVQREVVRVVSPGTFTDTAYLDDREPAFLMAVAVLPPAAAGAPDRYGMAVLDVSTGSFAAAEYDGMEAGEGLTAFLEHLALVAEVDSLDETADAITLITLHQAKGLEFPVVFIIGLQEGLLPHIRSMDDPEQLEEERRLFYVGITRCMDRLFLTRAFRQRGYRGDSGIAIPSRFLRDVPTELIAEVPQIAASRYGGQTFPDFSSGEASVAPRQRAKSTVGAGSVGFNGAGAEPDEEGDDTAFNEGDRVLHGVFGEGLVLKTAGQASDREVTVVFRDAGVKRLLLSFANLKRVES